MLRKSGFSFGDKRISIALLILVIYGSLMIVSAEMGNSAGNTSYLTSIMIHQAVFVIISLVAYFILMRFQFYRMRIQLYWVIYFGILILLLACRLFGERNGAYAWIGVGDSVTIQPSEFAKVFMVIFGAKLMEKDRGEKNRNNFVKYGICAVSYFLIIALYQHDFGSGIVLLVICYCIMLIPDYKEIRKYQRYMMFFVFVAIALVFVVLSNPVTEFLKKYSDHYMIARVLASANPFLYQYGNGYHLIMSMVSFANGSLFGLGYGNSIHKYMNFPNPSNDFILPVIVEELGIAGFIAFIVLYGILLFPLVYTSIKSKYIYTKMTLFGVFIYFIAHFILNVGGVSGLIPLTGVPLLIMSSGGSSLLASLISLGIVQSELERNKEKDNESHSRKI